MASLQDRILLITDLLLGAAHADNHLRGSEVHAVRKLLTQLLKTMALPDEVDARIKEFPSATFDVSQTAKSFAADPPENKRKLMELVAAVAEADKEHDFAEDDYMRALGAALGLQPADYKDLTLDYEMDELQASMVGLRATPPPPPGAKN